MNVSLKSKKKLELIFLMKVVLAFETFEDIKEFVLINKKCHQTIHALKVNPLFFNQPSYEKFFKYFTPETINCNLMELTDAMIFNKVKCIKNPNIDYFLKNKLYTKKQLKSFLDKVTTIQFCYNPPHQQNPVEKSYTTSDFLIENAIEMNNLRKVSGTLEKLIAFFKSYTKGGKEMNVNFPKIIQIELYDNVQSETLLSTVRNKFRMLRKYLRINDEMKITVISLLHPLSQDVLQSFTNFDYYYVYLTENQTERREEGMINTKGLVHLNGSTNGKRFENILEQCYCHELKMEFILKSPNEWELPRYIKKVTLYECTKTFEMGDDDNFVVGDDIYVQLKTPYLEELTLERCAAVKIKIDSSNLKVFNLLNCHQIVMEDYQEEKFTMIQQMQLANSSCCSIEISKECVEKMILSSLEYVLICGKLRQIKELVMSNCFESCLPILTFGNNSTQIEYCDRCFFSNTIGSESFYEHQYRNEDEEEEESDEENNEEDENDEDVGEESDENNDNEDEYEYEDIEEELDENEEEEEEIYEENMNDIQLRRLQMMRSYQHESNTVEYSKRDSEHNNPLSNEITYEDLIYLMNNSLILPNENLQESIQEFKTFFKMKQFHCLTNRVEMKGNEIIRKKPVYGEEFDPIVSIGFYDLLDQKGKKVKIIRKDNTIVELPHLISYYEIEVTGYCLLSYGVCETIEEYEQGEAHVGWIERSIGYHSDDGYMYNGDGKGRKYGPAYGADKNGHNIVGCGVDIPNKKIFFTCNGVRLKDINVQNMGLLELYAIVVVELFNKLTINCGEKPFEFDLEKAIKEIEQ